MLYTGYRRVDIDKDNVHGYSFYGQEPIEPTQGEGFQPVKDFVHDTAPDLQKKLIEAVRSKKAVHTERNRFGKVVGIID